MTVSQATIRTLLLLLAASAVAAQGQTQLQVPVRPATPSLVTIAVPILPHKAKAKPRPRPPQPPYNANMIVLDPAHGGSDAGANLGSAGEEKELNLAFAQRLKALLEAKEFTVVLTRASADDNPAPDQRAESTNRSRPVACLILHATNAGHGVHLFTSALTTPFFTGDAGQDVITLWDSAQAPSVAQSLQLANELSTALNGLRVPLVFSRVSVQPIDSLTCAAVAVEIAPAVPDSSLTDEAYLQHVAQSLVTALSYWRDHAKGQIAAQLAAFQAANPGDTTIPPAAAPKPKPKPKPIAVPEESPLVPDATAPARKPAPIERRPPPQKPSSPNGAQP